MSRTRTREVAIRTTSKTGYLALLLALVALPGCPSGAGGDAPAFTPMNAASHEPYFPIRRGNHGGIDCQECHGKVDTFREFRCVDCHEHQQAETGSNHLGISGYEYESRACYECHPRGDADDSAGNHELFFPIDTGSKHDDVACSGCHLSPSDRTLLACATCHLPADMTPAHGLVPDFEQESRLCIRCHADSQVDSITAHVPFQIGPGAPHDGDACLGCHPASRTDKPFGADFRIPECLGCHLDPETSSLHVGIPDYAYGTGACVVCHPTGEGAGTFDHSGNFPIGPGDDHEQTTCFECHANPADHADTACASCHRPPEQSDLVPLHAEVGGFEQVGALCKRCHADSQVDPVATHLPFVITSGDHHLSSCLACHPDVRRDRPFDAADFGRSECLGCHERTETTGEHAGVGDFEYTNGSCLLCHPDGQGATNLDHSGYFPIGATSEHSSVSCSECHANPDDHTVVACATCHAAADMTPAHVGVGGFAQRAGSCLRCHADSQVDRLSAHTPFRVRGKHTECIKCHEEVRADRPYPAADFGPYNCLGCHERRETDGHHDDEAGYAYVSTTCTNAGCHPDGRKHD